jgi:hypothetical protein
MPDATQQQQQQTQQQQPPAPAKGTPEYNKLMADRFEQQQSAGDPNAQRFEAPAKAQKPEGVPDKFWDAEKGEVRVAEMAKSYSELEKARTQKPQDKAQDKPNETDAAAQDAVKNAGLNWDDLGKKVATSGKLEDADYAALEKAGIPRDIVNNYIDLTSNALENARQATFTHVGKGDAAKGKQVVEDAMKWAGANLAPEEIAFYNAQLSSKSWKPALEAILSKMDQTRDEPDLLQGTGAGGEVGFASTYEMTTSHEQARRTRSQALRRRSGVSQQRASTRRVDEVITPIVSHLTINVQCADASARY